MRVVVLTAALAGSLLVSADGGSSMTGPHPSSACCWRRRPGRRTPSRRRRSAPPTVPAPLALTTVTSTAGASGCCPAACSPPARHTSSDPEVIGLLVYLGVMTLAVAYGLLYAGLRTVLGSAAVVATLLEPVTAAVLAAVVLDERRRASRRSASSAPSSSWSPSPASNRTNVTTGRCRRGRRPSTLHGRVPEGRRLREIPWLRAYLSRRLEPTGTERRSHDRPARRHEGRAHPRVPDPEQGVLEQPSVRQLPRMLTPFAIPAYRRMAVALSLRRLRLSASGRWPSSGR